MTDLSPEARRILAQARAGQARATPALRARVKAQVDHVRAAAVSSNPAPHSTTKHPWLLPGAGTLIVVGGLMTFATLQSTNPANTSPAREPASQQVSPASQPTEARPAGADTQRLSTARGENVAPAAVSGVNQALDDSSEEGSRPNDGAATDLRAEMQLLSRAEAALRGGEPQAALQVLRSHAQRFRGGQLQEEREGLRLIALCTLGRDPASALPRYLAKHHDAVLQVRVLEACSRFKP